MTTTFGAAGEGHSLPLDGFTVLDASDEVLVQAGRLLADLGARVIRIESLLPDAIRRHGPFVDGLQNSEHSLRHLHFNAGKQSVALDLDSDEAWESVDVLAVLADVVIAPMDKSKLAREFFDRARLAAVHPNLGVVDVVPKRGQPERPTNDLTAAAEGGLLYCNGFPDRAPDYPAGKLVYRQASFIAAGVAVALMMQRRRSGSGGVVSISLQEAAMSTTIQAANQNLWAWQGAVCQRAGMGGLRYPVLGPGGRVALVDTPGSTFETADGGWVVFGLTPFTISRWITFTEWYGELTASRALYGDIWYDALYRTEHRGEIQTAIARLCSFLPRDELVTRAQSLGLMAMPVNSIGDIVVDEQLIARENFPQIAVDGVDRPVPMLRSPFRSTAYTPVVRPAPRLSAHTNSLLSTAARIPTESETPANREGSEDFQPLKGYRVVDFCWQAAGPLVTELLAALGADVIKVESVARIDTVREFHHPPEGASIDTGAFFQDCNTGKRSILLNLSKPEGIALARRLIRTADIVTDNFTPDRMRRWGLGPDALHELNPQLITASFPVMGSSGPKSGWRGIGNSVVALSGLAGHMGDPESAPVGMGTLHTDFTLAPLAAAQIMAALLQRERTGQGQHIEIAQYEAALHLFDTEVLDCLVNGEVATRKGNRSSEYAPHGVFRSVGEDRWVAIAAGNTLEWQRLAVHIGRPDLASRSDLQSLSGRLEALDELEAAVESWSSELDPWEAADSLTRLEVPAAPLQHVGDIVEKDAAMADFFHRFTHPAGMEFMAQHQPFTWNEGRLPISRAPLLGEHNEVVYCDELGLSHDEFVDLMVSEVIY